MMQRFVKHLRQKPLTAALCVTVFIAWTVVGYRIAGPVALDVAFVVLAFGIRRPYILRVRRRVQARGNARPIQSTERIFFGARFDVLMMWLSDSRRHVAWFEGVWGRAHRSRHEPCPEIVGKPAETNEGLQFILNVPDEASYDSAWLAAQEVAMQDKAGDGCRNVRMARLNQGGRVICTFVMRDPLKIMKLGAPPVTLAKVIDIRNPTIELEWSDRRGRVVTETKPISTGMDVQGAPVIVQVYKRNILVGGLPDMGKSTWMAQLVAMIGLSTNARLWFIDAKAGIEVKPWRHTCHRFAIDATAADPLLLELETVMDATLAWIELNDLGEIDADEETPANILVIDELAELQLPGQQKRLRRIMSLGRAAGISVIAATQRPHNKLIDTNVRSLFHTAIAFGCKDENESDLILGEGMAGRGYNAGDLHASGEFYCVSSQSKPFRCLAYNFQRNQRRAVAARCKRSAESGREYGSGQSAPNMQDILSREAAGADWQTGPPADGEPPPAEAPRNGPDLAPGSPRAKVWQALVQAPDGLGFNEVVAAVHPVSRDTVTKALKAWQQPDKDGRIWCTTAHARYHAGIDRDANAMADVAS
jgi:S-DNA-T family DNA segregation ATPase FtsK/SpoIIIE